MTAFERPAPDVDKIVAAWTAWRAGGDEVLPGRTMADLKIGGTDRVLETLAEDQEVVVPIAEAWTAWERGRVGPEATLAALVETGFDDIVDAFNEPA